MYRFHAAVHPLPSDAWLGGEMVLAGRACRPLQFPAAALAAPLGTTFEAAGEALSRLERMFFEPDGAFVWVAPSGEPAWQVDGVLYDRGGRLLYAEIKGSCSPSALDSLLRALGWPETPLMFQLLQHAVYLDEAEFRRWCKRQPTDKPPGQFKT